MAQTPALFYADGDTMDYTPSGAIIAGEVVLIGTVPCVAPVAIPAGVKGVLAIEGIFKVPQAAEIIAEGAAVYWDADGTPVTGTGGTGAATGTATGNNLMGFCVEVTAATDSYVKVALTAAKRTATLGGAVTADSLSVTGAGGLSLLGTTGQPVLVLSDNLADALSIKDAGGGADLMVFKTTNGAEEVSVPTARLSAAGNVGNTAGVGITGTATSFVTSVRKLGTLIKTEILIDLAGLNSGGTADDVIGANGAGVAHLGQITAAVNGTIIAGRMSCLATPTTGDNDIDLWSATEATGVEDTAIGALTETKLCNSGDLTSASVIPLTALPAADQYLYLAGGTGDSSATYATGILLIELWGK